MVDLNLTDPRTNSVRSIEDLMKDNFVVMDGNVLNTAEEVALWLAIHGDSSAIKVVPREDDYV